MRQASFGAVDRKRFVDTSSSAIQSTIRTTQEGAPQTVGNGRQSYILAGYQARGNSADSGASRLLRSSAVQQRIAELRLEEERLHSVRRRHWRSLLPKAQKVLADAMDGRVITTQQLAAAREVIRQAEGPARFRFAVQDRGDTGSGLKVTLWSGRNAGEEEARPGKVG